MKRKLHLSLTQEEAKELLNWTHSLRSSSLIEKIKMLLEPDPDNPDPYIREKVYFALSDISGIATDEIRDSDDLKLDLGLSKYQKRALRDYFQQIVEDLESDKIVYVYECEALKKVKDCIKLVRSKV